jgi:RNA processing factor Prp31
MKNHANTFYNALQQWYVVSFVCLENIVYKIVYKFMYFISTMKTSNENYAQSITKTSETCFNVNLQCESVKKMQADSQFLIPDALM